MDISILVLSSKSSNLQSSIPYAGTDSARKATTISTVTQNLFAIFHQEEAYKLFFTNQRSSILAKKLNPYSLQRRCDFSESKTESQIEPKI
uniref:Uncharacterized protein n=1 Tax=Cucumis sativus TaxID=3659 RepID=A0A0A0KNX9_CUCSA